MLLQGVIFSQTAAANYADPSMLVNYAPMIPAKRIGSVQEVSSPGVCVCVTSSL